MGREITNTTKYQQKVLVEFYNSTPGIWTFLSNKKITLEKVIEYMIKKEDFDKETDSLTFLDEDLENLVIL